MKDGNWQTAGSNGGLLGVSLVRGDLQQWHEPADAERPVLVHAVAGRLDQMLGPDARVSQDLVGVPASEPAMHFESKGAAFP